MVFVCLRTFFVICVWLLCQCGCVCLFKQGFAFGWGWFPMLLSLVGEARFRVTVVLFLSMLLGIAV